MNDHNAVHTKLSTSYEASQEDIDFLWAGMIDFNKTTGPMMKFPPYEPYRILMKDTENRIVAGILTKVYLKCMFVDLLYLDPQYRKSGLGTRLLKEAEAHARQLGCTFIHLDTFSFQAIDFYKRQGYEVFGVIDDYPDEIKRYFLKKTLIS